MAARFGSTLFVVLVAAASTWAHRGPAPDPLVREGRFAALCGLAW